MGGRTLITFFKNLPCLANSWEQYCVLIISCSLLGRNMYHVSAERTLGHNSLHEADHCCWAVWSKEEVELENSGCPQSPSRWRGTKCFQTHGNLAHPELRVHIPFPPAVRGCKTSEVLKQWPAESAQQVGLQGVCSHQECGGIRTPHTPMARKALLRICMERNCWAEEGGQSRPPHIGKGQEWEEPFHRNPTSMALEASHGCHGYVSATDFPAKSNSTYFQVFLFLSGEMHSDSLTAQQRLLPCQGQGSSFLTLLWKLPGYSNHTESKTRTPHDNCVNLPCSHLQLSSGLLPHLPHGLPDMPRPSLNAMPCWGPPDPPQTCQQLSILVTLQFMLLQEKTPLPL